LQRSAVEAGLALTMLLVGWPVAATFASRTFHRFGIRRLMLTGSMLAPAGASLFLFLNADSSPLFAALGSLIMGFGMGLMSITALILIQEIATWSERGSATASNVFSRNLGSTLGAAVLGAVLNYQLRHSSGSGTVSPDQFRALLNGVDIPEIAGASARAVLQASLHSTFIAMFAVTALIVLACWSLPLIVLGNDVKAPSAPGH
jgi:MFS family permease